MKRLLLVGCATVLWVGCGSGGEHDPRGQISVGVFMPLTTGPLSSQAPGWEAAVKVANNEINQAGGVLHSDIYLDLKDSQSDNG